VRIYSMTATFGKLENQTITFHEGLNIIEAPNEWGKSTWCAFLVAMLYGIDTSQRTKTGVLADKLHYAPWSGLPMAGRMELNWDGRDITIERSSTARIPFGEFRAWETASGLTVRELTAANCGLQLLGVEKEVFLRSGFLRLKDLPVTADDSLRRRLNSLVTTGNENDACDDLAQQLKDYKNACYANRSNGLLPQAQAEAAQLEEKIRSLQELQVQIRYTRQRQEDAQRELFLLENHLAALRYEANRDYHERLSTSQAARDAALKRLEKLKADCAQLPELSTLQQKQSYLQSLADQYSALQQKIGLLPPPPPLPQVPAPYPGATPDAALEQAQADASVYQHLAAKAKNKTLLLAGIAAVILGIAAVWIPWQYALYAGIGVAALGAVLTVCHLLRSGSLKKQCAALQGKYGALPADQWTKAAQDYVTAQKSYMQFLQEHQAKSEALQQQLQLLEQSLAQATDGEALEEKQAYYHDAIRLRHMLADEQKEVQHRTELVQALESSYQESPPPTAPDELLLSEEETVHSIAALQMEQQQLQRKLGLFQGQAETLGEEAHLQAKLEQVHSRIDRITRYHQALLYALDLLDTTKRELQRRFAPQITKQAEVMMGAMTGGRYDRLHLEHDLTLRAGTGGEINTYEALWRSDGTVDQLYLALRLAVAEALLPGTPLVLDDALVRFDDTRLAAALKLLQQLAENKQVILFTCQGREKRILDAGIGDESGAQT